VIDILESMRALASRMDEQAQRSLDMEQLVIERGAIKQAAPYLASAGFTRAIVVSDKTTYAIAGSALVESIKEVGIDSFSTVIHPDRQGDVIADEASVVQLILDIQRLSADVVIAAGSGTIHDITRFAAYTARIPFIAVPTAPSVDGFNSKGAPLILRGEKQTIQSIGPRALFADLDILTKAPAPMVAAGFGDMLGKYTSLFDWKFGTLVHDEPFHPVVYNITRDALQECIDHVDGIARRDEEGIRTLIGALIESGFAMLLFGLSHPASGAEHHVSHYWEMEYIRQGKRQLLHGAKVGVACAEISKLYHRIAEEGLPIGGATEEVGRRMAELSERIREEIRSIPEEDQLREWIRRIGGPDTAEKLGVDNQLLERSLKEAHHVRPNRFTLLRAYNTM
jgi:glycerol-1-phosphate dehydrogenase [NAD(P)+]